MIVFASSITSPEVYERCAKPGFGVAAEPNTQVMSESAAGSIFRSYNRLMDKAAALDDLEALVLVHQDAEIVDPGFCPKLREALSDPDVAVVGCVGAIGARTIAWWEASVTWASFTHRYRELGGGEFPALSWNGTGLPPFARTGEVETVDGFVLGLSPWAVRNVRFDESLGQALHGYDFDFCLQVREAGRKVATADFKVVHHHSLELASDLENWIDAHMSVAEKWDGRMPNVGVAAGDWKHRARRAEAEAAAARAGAMSMLLQTDVGARQHEDRLREMTDSTSWRLTSPLRRLSAIRSAVRERRSRRSGVEAADG